MTEYNPEASTINQERLDEFLNSDIVADLTSVPGIGPANKKLLQVGTDEDDPCCTTWQLIGKYLSMKTENMCSIGLNNSFYYYLKAKGINASRNTIVLAISEKVALMMPGIQTSTVIEMIDEEPPSAKWLGIF